MLLRRAFNLGGCRSRQAFFALLGVDFSLAEGSGSWFGLSLHPSQFGAWIRRFFPSPVTQGFVLDWRFVGGGSASSFCF